MLVGESVELRQLQHLAGPGAPLPLVALDLARPEEEVEQSLAGIVLRGEDEVLQDRQVAKFVGNLPGLGEPEVHNLIRGQSIDPCAVEPDLPAVVSIEPGNDVEQRRFLRSVRPDETRDGVWEVLQSASIAGVNAA